jgi:flagellar hook-associated protein 1 FlgK
MGGLGFALSTAKDALLTQRLAIDVVSHNIANVNTEGYTRQVPHMETNDPAPYGGVVLGRGVGVDTILQITNSFIETRLQQGKTDLASLEQKEIYLGVLEGIFNESSGTGLSAQLADFWNSWHDLSNNPSGLAERSVVFERGALVSQTFRDLSEDLSRVTQEINGSIGGSTSEINDILQKIADLNPQIVSLKLKGNANDLLDKRNELLGQLSEFMDIRYYEKEDGNITVTTGNGYILVSGLEVYSLSFDGNRVRWESSGATEADITDSLKGGKLGGWLDLRDAILPQYQAELDEMAKTIVWEINRVHSVGAGLAGSSAVTGTESVTDPAVSLASGSLAYAGRIDDAGKTFKIRLYDAAGQPYDSDGATAGLQGNPIVITVTPGMTLNGLRDAINAASGLQASINGDNQLTISIDHGVIPSGSFAFSDDESSVLAALGINTFFKGSAAGDMDMNPAVKANKSLIAAARVDAEGRISSGDNSNALELANLQFQTVSMSRYHMERGESPLVQSVQETIDSYLHSFSGTLGILSQSVSRSKEFSEVMVQNFAQTRDNISAVSLDEEMTNLMKYQQAYAAAAKLISTVDQMFNALLETR